MKYFITILFIMSLATKTMALNIQERQLINTANASQLVEIAEWQSPSASVAQLNFNPNDASLALIQNDQSLGYGSVTFLNPKTLEPIKPSKSFSNSLAITFSPDGTLFAEVDDSGHLNIYKTQDLELYSQIEVGLEPILNLAIDVNNRYVAVAVGAPEIVTSGKYAFQLFEVKTGKVILSLDRRTTDIDEIFGTGTVFDSKGENVFFSTSDGIVHKWNIVSKEQAIIGEGALRSTRMLAPSATFQAIYLTQDGDIRLVDKDNKKRDVTNTQHKDTRYFLASSMAVHPNEPIMAVGYIMPSNRTTASTARDSILELWNIDTGELLLETIVSEPGHNRLTSLAFSPDGTLLASGGTDGTVRLWGVKE